MLKVLYEAQKIGTHRYHIEGFEIPLRTNAIIYEVGDIHNDFNVSILEKCSALLRGNFAKFARRDLDCRPSDILNISTENFPAIYEYLPVIVTEYSTVAVAFGRQKNIIWLYIENFTNKKEIDNEKES